jgi:hypothetical protein
MSEILILWFISIFQVVIALGLVNVWLVRFHKPTHYRGGGAGNMEDEFSAYGLPKWFMYMVGAAKMLIALCMSIGFWIPALVYPASVFLVMLMIGAIVMHLKVKDPFIRTVPALLMFLVALANILLIKVF